ncbi:MAG TPA: PEGA domain-containing protein [Candidatus Acidoferrales bacterium]|jgi:hypothetical protein|nr:PEGA domain-containing protein [Candidatus Acidoferrales bacterium]
MRLSSGLKLLLLVAALMLSLRAQKQQEGADRRAELAQVLTQRYRVTRIGPGLLGLRGGAGSIRQAGGVVEARRPGLYGSLERNGAATMNVRGDQVEVIRGHKDYAFPAGEQFYVHSVYVGQDVISLGVLTPRLISTPRGTGRLWATLNFFLPTVIIANVDTNAISAALDQWLLPEGQRPAPVAATPAPPPAPAAPAPPAAPTPGARADLKPGMTREDVLIMLGTPQREVSYGPRTWLTYPDLVAVLENGKLSSVDRSGQPPAKVMVRSEPDGADVYLGDSFVGSTPAALELPAGTYKVSVRLQGYKDWQREVQVLGGSELTLRPRLEKIAQPSSLLRRAPLLNDRAKVRPISPSTRQG